MSWFRRNDDVVDVVQLFHTTDLGKDIARVQYLAEINPIRAITLRRYIALHERNRATARLVLLDRAAELGGTDDDITARAETFHSFVWKAEDEAHRKEVERRLSKIELALDEYKDLVVKIGGEK